MSHRSTKWIFSLAAVLVLTSLNVGCQTHSAGLSSAPRRLIAVLHPTRGHQTHGTVVFEAVSGGVKVTADVQGLAPNSRHGIHIHAYGDCSNPAGKSAGGHYNPQSFFHGLPPAAKRHAGDLGNLTANAQGIAHYQIVVHNISLAGALNPILGRGVIVHAKPDDGGQPTGHAGARLACGSIGLAKP